MLVFRWAPLHMLALCYDYFNLKNDMHPVKETVINTQEADWTTLAARDSMSNEIGNSFPSPAVPCVNSVQQKIRTIEYHAE